MSLPNPTKPPSGTHLTRPPRGYLEKRSSLPKHCFIWIEFLNHCFYDRSHIAGAGELSIPLLLDEKSKVVLVGAGSPAVKRANYRKGLHDKPFSAVPILEGDVLLALVPTCNN